MRFGYADRMASISLQEPISLPENTDPSALLGAVIDSLAIEVLVYAEDDTLMIWNRAFKEAYAADTGSQPYPGQPLEDVVRSRLVGVGRLSLPEIEEVVARRLAFRASSATEFEFVDCGRDMLLRESSFGTHTVVTLLDISDMRTAEREKQRVQGVMKSIMDAQPVTLAFFDAEKRLAYWNDRFERSYEAEAGTSLEAGLLHREILARRVAGRTDDEEAAAAMLELGTVLFNAAADNEVHIGDRDFFVQRKRTPDGGTVVAWVDVTRLKETERALEQSNLEMREANQDLQRFTAAASHELRAPMRAITSFSEIIYEDQAARLDDSGRECLEYVRTGAQRMNALIDELLNFHCSERDVGRLECIDLPGLAEEMRVDFAPLLATEGSAIETSGLSSVSVDALVKTVIRNLVSNGLKYQAPENAPRVRVSCTEGDGVWVFEVADNGIGIDAEQQDRIFDLFERLHGRGEYAGSGIGLATVRRIVHKLGGRLWVESEPGEGSRFYFELPMARSIPA